MAYLMKNFKKMNYTLILISIFTILSNCKRTSLNTNSDDINYYAEFHYYNQDANYPMRFTCGSLKSNNPNNGRNYKKISDKVFMDKLVSYYTSLENSKDERFDARIQFLVHLPNKVDTICMGEYFGIVVNGVPKEDSEEFVNFVKNEIYKK